MILLLDAGNSRVKWGIREAGAWLARGTAATRDVGHLREVLADYPLRRALLSSVAGEGTQAALVDMLAKQGVEAAWLTADADGHGIRNRYRPAASLGPDRYAALVAAARLGRGDCVVACVGTAMTADALTADGVFLGGAIAPGPDLMQSALRQGTAGVRRWSDVVQAFPDDTGTAVATGIALALAGVVMEMRARLARHAGRAVTVVLSGGARAALATCLPPPLVEVDDLVLEGLVWIAKDREWDD